MFQIRGVAAVSPHGCPLLQWNPAQPRQEERRKQGGDNAGVLPTLQDGGRRDIETRPHHDLPKVVRVLNDAPQSVLDKLTLQYQQ